MKTKILNLGKVLNKTEQRNVNGGASGTGFIRCYFGGSCIRYGKMCKEAVCRWNPA